MAQTYKVQVVSEKEWGKITKQDPRYRNTADSIGFADPIKRTAYVRDTHFEELNKHLVNHEFEHLVEEHATDQDEFGIRHKKGFLRNFGAIMAAPFTGGTSLFTGSDTQHPVIGKPGGTANEITNTIWRVAPQLIGGALGGFGGPGGAAAGAGLGSALGDMMTGGNPNVGKAAISAGVAGIGQGLTGGMSGKSFMGSAPVQGGAGTVTGTQGMNAFGGVGSNAYGPAAAPTASTVSLPSAGAGVGGGPLAGGGLTQPLFPNGIPGAAPSQAGLGAFKAPSPMTSNPFSGASVASPGGMPPPILPMSTTSNVPSTPSVSTPTVQATQSTSNTNTPGSNPLQAIGNFAKNNPLVSGAAVAGIGDLFAPKVQAPNFGSIPSIEELKAKMGGSLSPLGALGQQQLSARLSSPFSGLQPGAEDSIRNTFQRERQNLISQFKALRPNADLTSDSAFRQSMFTLDQQEADAIANAKQNAYGEFNTTRTNDIASALGVDTQTLNTMVSLAQLDIATIMGKLGVDSAQAQQFKQTWAQIGSAIAGGGVGNMISGTTATTPKTP